MGNRATVVFTDGHGNFSPAAYLHWNGGPESVYGFLEELDRRKVRADQDYEAARFIQLVGEFFDQGAQGGLSLGVANGPASDALDDLNKIQTDHGDNGLYLVNRTGGEDRVDAQERPTTARVRRFIEERIERQGTVSYEFVEMPAEAVERERADAAMHEYREGFREFYKNLAATRAEESQKAQAQTQAHTK